MQSTPVGADAQADFGTTTIILIEQGARAQKLLRLRALKAALREMRSEYETLERELFGQAAP
jgi:hypothetical protein